MSALSNISIQSKILSALGLFALLCGFLVWFGSSKLETAAAETSGLTNNQAESLRVAALAMEHTTKINALWFEMISQPPARQAELINEIAEERKGRAENLAVLRPFIDGPDVARFAIIETGLRDNQKATAKIPAMLNAGDSASANVLMAGEVSASYDRVDDAFSALVDQQDNDLDAGAKTAEEEAASSRWTLIIVALAGLLAIGSVALLLIRKQVVNPINAITAIMAKLTAGDNNVVVAGIERRDEVGAMSRALLVFRDTAVAKAAADADKAAADATLQMVVDSLGSSLSELSNRDLTNRVT